MRVAVVGAGISGLSAALRLQPRHAVTVFEADARAGGHTNTVDVTLDGVTHGVDTGFLVFNERTYPKLIALFAELGVPTAKSDMSFAVSVRDGRFEWCGSDLSTVFAQPSNALRPRFWGMLADLLRFNREATALARRVESEVAPRGATLSAGRRYTANVVSREEDGASLGEWLDARGYGRTFRDGYLVPMAAAIWSCPLDTMLRFPVTSFVRFCHNHGLLQVTDRPQWFTVAGGGREYVRRIAERLRDLRTGTPVRRVRRPAGGGVEVTTDAGMERFDAVVMACHSDRSLALLDDADDAEHALLGAVPYQPNVAVLHTDTALMPARRRAWAAWNYLSDGDPKAPAVSVTYWLNRLQPLPFRTPVLVSLNPIREPRPERVIARFDYSHPVFDAAAIDAQRRLPSLQGERDTWHAGAWTGWGFHEDGLASGLAAAAAIEARAAATLRAAA